jgi:predicted ATPase
MGSSLDKITIKGFKSILELKDFELKNLNIIVGANGAGKSNFIEFFRLISAMMKPDGLKAFVSGNADSFLFGGPKLTPQISVEMKFGKNGYDFELAPTEDGFLIINNEKRHYFPHGATRNFGSGNFNPGLVKEKDNSGYFGSKSATGYTYDAITSWQIYHFHDTSKQAGMRRFQESGHNKKLFDDASNIAAYLLRLQKEHPKNYRDIINAVRLVIPFFDDFILEPNNNEQIRLEWKQKGLADYPMKPTHLSDGSIRFICLATALLQPSPPSTIIIDEPELGLHPAAIVILAELIQVASQRTQVIVATQSPALIDQFGIDEIIVANREDGVSTFKRLKEEDFSEWLKDYSVGQLWMKNVISGGPVYE